MKNSKMQWKYDDGHDDGDGYGDYAIINNIITNIPGGPKNGYPVLFLR